MTTPTPGDLLELAAEAIGELGWVQGVYRSNEGVCLLGALNEAQYRLYEPGVKWGDLSPVYLAAHDRLHQEIREATQGVVPSVSHYNDEHLQSGEEAILLLKRAAARDE